MVSRRWKSAVLVLLAVVAAGCGGGGGGDGSGADAPAAVAPASRPALAIDERVETFVDVHRPTSAVGDAPEAPTRTLATVVLAPVAGQPGRPYPLVVFAHGSGGRGRGDHLLLRAWASAGYVVAAPTFPFGGGRAPEGEGGNDLVNQPADVNFVISELLRLSADGASPLAGSVDPARVGAAGHSLGGMTTLALAGNTCCHDARVKAAVVLAGREMPFGRGQFWTRIRTPILFVHGEEDASVPYADGRRAFANAPPPRFLLTIVAGDHGRPFGGATDDVQARLVTDATLDFFDHYLKGDPGGLARLQTDATVPGVSRLESEV
jgi:dienelactone hydrolase